MNWERWARAAGIVFVVLFAAGFLIMGEQPKIGEADKLVSFYDGDRGRVLTGVTLIMLAVVAVIWFIGAIANALREAGEGRVAATSIALAATFLGIQSMIVAITAALAQSIAAGSDPGVTSALNALRYNIDVSSAFLLAGLLTVLSVGLTRARILPAWFLLLGLVAGFLVLLRGTNWASEGFWAPDGDYFYVAMIAAVAWTLVTSVLLYQRAPATR